jgi:alkylhydroperoxidase family enzyme
MDGKYQVKLADLHERLIERAGTLDPAVRRAAAEGTGVPQPLVAYVDKVRRHAYTVTDGDVEGLRAAGYSEDQIFELTVAAAYGAARKRLDAGLAAMASPVRLPEPEPEVAP